MSSVLTEQITLKSSSRRRARHESPLREMQRNGEKLSARDAIADSLGVGVRRRLSKEACSNATEAATTNLFPPLTPRNGVLLHAAEAHHEYVVVDAADPDAKDTPLTRPHALRASRTRTPTPMEFAGRKPQRVSYVCQPPFVGGDARSLPPLAEADHPWWLAPTAEDDTDDDDELAALNPTMPLWPEAPVAGRSCIAAGC